jgi:hypothetical protein
MNPLHETRLKIRRELEAPPALRKFGSGWISGVLGMMFGLAALGTVIMMRFPGVFTMKENAGVIGHPAFRTGMFVLMVLAFVFSLLNLVLRPSKALGMTGMIATLLAVTFGGTSASAVAPDLTPVYFGLDFFVLRLPSPVSSLSHSKRCSRIVPTKASSVTNGARTCFTTSSAACWCRCSLG